MKNNIPTAEELLAEITPVIIAGMELHTKEIVLLLMKLNAKYHVEAALKAASETCIKDPGDIYNGTTDKESILNSYPTTNIK